MASEKIRTSWFYSSSVAPKPSVSSTSTFMGSPSGVKPSTGLPQIHTPYYDKNNALETILIDFSWCMLEITKMDGAHLIAKLYQESSKKR